MLNNLQAELQNHLLGNLFYAIWFFRLMYIVRNVINAEKFIITAYYSSLSSSSIHNLWCCLFVMRKQPPLLPPKDKICQLGSSRWLVYHYVWSLWYLFSMWVPSFDNVYYIWKCDDDSTVINPTCCKYNLTRSDFHRVSIKFERALWFNRVIKYYRAPYGLLSCLRCVNVYT